MNTWQLALLYLKRKRTRAFLLLLVLSLIASSLYSSLAIKSQITVIREDIAKLLASSFHLASPTASDFNLANVQKALEVEGISKVNYRYEQLAMSRQLTTLSAKQTIQLDKSANTQKLFKIIALSSTELTNEFTSGAFQLVEGRHLVATDHQQVMVHVDLARKNGLKLGDKVSLQALFDLSALDATSSKPLPNIQEHLGKEAKYEIVGLFKGLINTIQQGLSSDLSENTLFMPYVAGQQLMGKVNVKDYLLNALDCYLLQGADVERVKTDVEQALLNSQKLKISSNNSQLEQTASSLISLQALLTAMTIGIILAASLVLAFLLIMQVRERIREIGIKLALGTSKLRICQQFVLELVYLSFIAIGLTAFLGPLLQRILGQGLQKLLTDASKLNVLAQTAKQSFFNTQSLSLLSCYGLLLLIIVGVSACTLAVYLNQTPKKILSKMS